MKSFFMLLIGGLLLSSNKKERITDHLTTLNPLHAVSVYDAAGFLSDGTLDVTQFVCNNGRIWAQCKLRGVCLGIHIDQDCLVPITVGDCSGGIRLTSSTERIAKTSASTNDCECLTITFEGCTITVNPTSPVPTTPTLSILPQELQCGVQDFPGDALCCANTLIGNPSSSIYDICSCMNRLL